MFKLILLFTIIPLIELTLLIQISYHIGTASTVIIVAITGVIGAILSKKQGTDVLKKIRKSLAEGELPADNLIAGLLVLIGGIMLITPGLLTDLLGFSCIIPITRRKIKKLTQNNFNKLITTGRVQFFSFEKKEETNSKTKQKDEIN